MEVFLDPFVPAAEHNDQLTDGNSTVAVSGPGCHPRDRMDFSPLRILDAHFPVGIPKFGAVDVSTEWAGPRKRSQRCQRGVTSHSAGCSARGEENGRDSFIWTKIGRD